MATVIPASEAKAKFAELLDRVLGGESFSITLHGEERAKLVPGNGVDLEQVRGTITRMKSERSALNSPGQAKLKVKDLVHKGRP